MARLAWDQSFLDNYSGHHGQAVLEASSSDPLLISYREDPHKKSFYQNFNSNPFLDNDCSEFIPNDVKLERIYQNLLSFHNYINTNLTLPCSLTTQKCSLNHACKPRKAYKKLHNENANAHSDKVTSSRLKHLLEEISRKETSQRQDNTYFSSSPRVPSYCHHSRFPKPQLASKNSNCGCLEAECPEFKNIEQFLPPLNLLNNSPNPSRLSRKYALFEILRSKLDIAKINKSSDSSGGLVSGSDKNPGDKSKSECNKREENFSDEELHILKLNLVLLLQCGFYHGRVSSDEASSLLSSKPVGTFFLRDSSNPNYLLSLSFKTTRGPTSIRILFHQQRFSLETDLHHYNLQAVPRCNSLLRLIQHFVQNPNKSTLEESSGRCDTPLLLQTPLFATTPSLAHLARLRINQIVGGVNPVRSDSTTSIDPHLKQ